MIAVTTMVMGTVMRPLVSILNKGRLSSFDQMSVCFATG